jgi:hypothetical protein
MVTAWRQHKTAKRQNQNTFFQDLNLNNQQNNMRFLCICHEFFFTKEMEPYLLFVSFKKGKPVQHSPLNF